MIPKNLERVEGHNLILRLIQPEDAEYVHALRSNSVYNTHLSSVSGDVEDQRNWIVSYKTREDQGSEYYYVIERKDDARRCGLVRLYDIGPESFTWGSWILDHNKTPKAALESAILSFDIGFNSLDLPNALVDVRIRNERAINIYKRFGMTELRRDERDIYFIYLRSCFAVDHANYLEAIGGV